MDLDGHMQQQYEDQFEDECPQCGGTEEDCECVDTGAELDYGLQKLEDREYRDLDKGQDCEV